MKKESFDEKVGWGRMLLVGFPACAYHGRPGTIAVPLDTGRSFGIG